MTTGEELMVFFELNGYDISKYRLKKQLTNKVIGNLELIQKESLEDFLISYYAETEIEVVKTNPLIYFELWEKLKIDKEKIDIEDFIIDDPRVDSDTTIHSFLNDKMIKDEIKARIIDELFTRWVKEYKEYHYKLLERINEWQQKMIADIEYYHVPKVTKAFIMAVQVVILFLCFYSTLPVLTWYHDAIRNTPWFNIYWLILFLTSIYYIIQYDHFRVLMRNLKKTWYKKFSKRRLKIEKKIDEFDFVFMDVIKNEEIINKNKQLGKLSKVRGINQSIKEEEKLIQNHDKQFTKILNKYGSYLSFGQVGFFSLTALNIVFIILGFVLSRGWI